MFHRVGTALFQYSGHAAGTNCPLSRAGNKLRSDKPVRGGGLGRGHIFSGIAAGTWLILE